MDVRKWNRDILILVFLVWLRWMIIIYIVMMMGMAVVMVRVAMVVAMDSSVGVAMMMRDFKQPKPYVMVVRASPSHKSEKCDGP